jgi:hypothetical protein
MAMRMRMHLSRRVPMRVDQIVGLRELPLSNAPVLAIATRWFAAAVIVYAARWWRGDVLIGELLPGYYAVGFCRVNGDFVVFSHLEMVLEDRYRGGGPVLQVRIHAV